MAIFKSDTFLVTVGNDVISNFLCDPKNLIEILPQDRIEDWKADDTTCSFKIKGLASIFLSLESAEKHIVIFKSNSEKPFSFRLIVDPIRAKLRTLTVLPSEEKSSTETFPPIKPFPFTDRPLPHRW